MSYVFIFISIATMTAAQLLLKKGLILAGESPHSLVELLRLFYKTPSCFYVLSAVLLTIITALSWMQAASKMEISYIYPFMALSYVFVALFSLWLFRDQVSVLRWAGIAIVCLGVFLVSRS
jgi:drug/metabolite transporter (DMT)-like permease